LHQSLGLQLEDSQGLSDRTVDLSCGRDEAKCGLTCGRSLGPVAITLSLERLDEGEGRRLKELKLIDRGGELLDLVAKIVHRRRSALRCGLSALAMQARQLHVPSALIVLIAPKL
jgi:hypothetical protein